jgi:hypothetical protein
VVDVVGEVGGDGFVGHAVGGGDEFDVGGGDEGGQSGGGQDAGLDADRVEGVFDVAVGGESSGGFGLLGDQQVWVAAAQGVTVGDAAFERGPGPGVQWCGVGSAAESDGPAGVVDRVVG